MFDYVKFPRSRDEQIADLAAHIKPPGWEGSHLVLARTHILEAEARGAAEARAEDAKGCEPAARVDGAWSDGLPMLRTLEAGRKMPLGTLLYDRPANVAALEARVKGLKAQLAKVTKPEWYDIHGDEELYSDVESIMKDIYCFDVRKIEGYAVVTTIWAFIDDNGKVYEFSTREEANAACAALAAIGEAP